MVASAEPRRGGKHYLLGFNTTGRFEIPACIQGGRFTFAPMHDLPHPRNLIAAAGDGYAHRVVSAPAEVRNRNGHPALMLLSTWGEVAVPSLREEKVVFSLSGENWGSFLLPPVEGKEEAYPSPCVPSEKRGRVYRLHS